MLHLYRTRLAIDCIFIPSNCQPTLSLPLRKTKFPSVPRQLFLVKELVYPMCGQVYVNAELTPQALQAQSFVEQVQLWGPVQEQVDPQLQAIFAKQWGRVVESIG